MRVRVLVGAMLCLALAAAARARPGPDAECILASGNATAKCVRRYASALGACRNRADAECEAQLRDGGRLGELVAAVDDPTRRACTEASAAKLTYALGVDELLFREHRTCETWGEELVGRTYADDVAALSPPARACQRRVARRLSALREKIVHAYGPNCYAAEADGQSCERGRRDTRVAKATAETAQHILKTCGAQFDALGIANGRGPTLDARVDWLVGQVADTARHLAQQAYPPLLAPAGVFGAHPVGVRTLDLEDPSRPRPIEPRLLRTEVYYPADPAAVAGIPRDHLVLEDVDRGEIPAYREVARAAGTFPLIVYSHLGGGERHEAVFRLTHLASHGFVVVSADHVDSPDGEFDEAQYENRPLDVSFLIDRFLAFSAEPGHFLEGAVDPARIGATGGSFGGYTVTVLAVGPFFRGTFTDPRVKAILPQDAPLGVDYEHFAADAPALFETVTISALALGGDTLNSVPFAPGIQAFFDTLVPGPAVLGYGKLHGAIHRSFVDECDFHGSLPCFGYLMPSSYVARIVGYLAVNFFEAVLNEDAAALGRLQPAAVAAIDDLIFQSK